jgi:hypothetical protein
MAALTVATDHAGVTGDAGAGWWSVSGAVLRTGRRGPRLASSLSLIRSVIPVAAGLA